MIYTPREVPAPYRSAGTNPNRPQYSGSPKLKIASYPRPWALVRPTSAPSPVQAPGKMQEKTCKPLSRNGLQVSWSE